MKKTLTERFQQLAGIKELRQFTPDKAQAILDKEGGFVLSDEQGEAVELIQKAIDNHKDAKELTKQFKEIYSTIFAHQTKVGKYND